MDNEGLKRLQEIAAKAAQGMDVATGLPTPPALTLPVAAEPQHPSDAAAKVISLNRAQRRRGRATSGHKRAAKDPEVHAYAERVRRMTDQQIWDWGHRGNA